MHRYWCTRWFKTCNTAKYREIYQHCVNSSGLKVTDIFLYKFNYPFYWHGSAQRGLIVMLSHYSQVWNICICSTSEIIWIHTATACLCPWKGNTEKRCRPRFSLKAQQKQRHLETMVQTPVFTSWLGLMWPLPGRKRATYPRSSIPVANSARATNQWLMSLWENWFQNSFRSMCVWSQEKELFTDQLVFRNE